jgi:NAD-dependent dihydropyrimidine dehydrogenase PreA subunit
MQDTTLADLVKLFPEQADSIEETLQRMVKRGTVFVDGTPGATRTYKLLPSVVGWAETPFWAGKDTPQARKLAPLWLRYRDEAFGAELARAGTPPLRVIPISENLRESTQVLPYDALRTKVEEQEYCAVAKCPCRQMKKYVGQGCDHSLENCLHFGSMGRYMVEQGMARQVSHAETLAILAQAHEEGLVHAVDNISEGLISTICNCCGCCCIFLDTKKKMGLHTISRSNYVARVDPELCLACGVCNERCPVEAIAVGDDEVSEVNPDLCIGCGVCTTCVNDAVELEQRAEIVPPPGVVEMLTRRWKTL